MKKNLKRMIACGLCGVAILSGCGDSTKENNSVSEEAMETSTLASDLTEKKLSSVELVTQIKAKYEKEENLEYTEPLYNLEKDHVFVFEDLPVEVTSHSADIFEVFYDSELKEAVSIDIDEEYSDDHTKGKITIKPSFVYYCGEDRGSIDDGTWGSRSKFWLVRYKDLETGETLDKPVVTVFTIKKDLNTPTLRQTVNKNGEYTLSWTEVEGADYYEVYQRYTDSDYPTLEVATENLSCISEEFASVIDYKKRFQETYADTELANMNAHYMNKGLYEDYSFFVIAKTYDEKCSGLSNMCNVQDVFHQMPYCVGDFEVNYEGNTSLVLPAYINMEMKDGSTGEYLIQYHKANASLLEDGRIMIEAKVKNLDIEMPAIFLEGMEFSEFLEDVEQVTEREDALARKAVVSDVDVDIPYLPEFDDEDYNEVEEREEEGYEVDGYEIEEYEEEYEEEEYEEEGYEIEEYEEEEYEEELEVEETEMPKVTQEPESESESDDNEEKYEEDEQQNNSQSELELSDKLKNSVYANSALSEWIAINMLDHKEDIYIGDFQESADTEKITDAVLEAYTQNPLIGVMESVDYDYKSSTIIVSYQLSEEETKKMQEASLIKAKEIADEVVTSGMSDYEKEEAINQYLCENSTYNMDIFNYINSDGTVDNEATEKYVHSFTPYGILVENTGVCESYSEAFMMIAREADLEAIIVTGTMEGVNHEWNRVKLDGKWYSMDVTNNDGDIFKNCYFNLSDETAARRLKQDKDALLDKHVKDYCADDMDNEYYTKNDLVAKDSTEAVEKLSMELDKNDIAVVRVPENLSKNDIETIVEQVCQEKGLGATKYYYIEEFVAMEK